ncbi:DUF957 domain-containing protein [Hafnia alvei]|uniref:YeeW-like domain-containing protein n=1 Tax=Hafnia alvei TaxID=569 RepID=A0A1C6Z7J7_HAFAL|nr:DUF5983 family protein [Hafnia alvei]NLS55433.1 DUF957 domain-containing protein [Hafnia alvei]SCM55015.1 protein of unknown function (DUF957) [Hafnia alvei]
MILSLTLEADAVNILALNMGRIAVDIDGIDLSALIEAINNNGCTLLLVNEPECETVSYENSGPLTTEQGLEILIRWLEDNIDADSTIIFDNDDDRTDSAALLPCIARALADIRQRQIMNGQ